MCHAPVLQGVPKSSFLTEEKRARLKTNPVKVHFAEEVLVSAQSQVRLGRAWECSAWAESCPQPGEDAEEAFKNGGSLGDPESMG